MGPDEERHTAAYVRPPTSGGGTRALLATLDAAVRARPGLACGVVTRQGRHVLHVINSVLPRRSVEVGCDLDGDDRHFVWASSGRVIGPVDDPETTADAIAATLGTSTRSGERHSR